MYQELACGLTRADLKPETEKLVSVAFQTLLIRTYTRHVKYNFILLS